MALGWQLTLRRLALSLKRRVYLYILEQWMHGGEKDGH